MEPNISQKPTFFEVPLSSQPHIEMLPKMNLDTAYAENRCDVNVSTFRISRRTDWYLFFLLVSSEAIEFQYLDLCNLESVQ